MKPSEEKQQQKARRETGSTEGGDTETVMDSADESESSPGEQLRMNIPTLYTQSALSENQEKGLYYCCIYLMIVFYRPQ